MMGTTEAIFSMVSRLNERGGRLNVRQGQGTEIIGVDINLRT